MALRENAESEADRLQKQQKHLRAKLLNLPGLPEWFEERLCQDAGLTAEELLAIQCSGGQVLSEEKLDAAWTFLRRWQAGGVTKDGKPVELASEPLERMLSDEKPETSTTLARINGVDVEKAKKALAAMNHTEAAPEATAEPAPAPEPNVRMQEIADRLAKKDHAPTVPQGLAVEQRKNGAGLEDHEKARWLQLCDRWEALAELRKIRGFKNRFMQRANWQSYQTMKALESRTPIFDVNDKYWWIESALKWAEGGGFVLGMSAFLDDDLEEIERAEKGLPPKERAEAQPETPCAEKDEAGVANDAGTITLEISAAMVPDLISHLEVVMDCFADELHDINNQERDILTKRHKFHEKVRMTEELIARLRNAQPV